MNLFRASVALKQQECSEKTEIEEKHCLNRRWVAESHTSRSTEGTAAAPGSRLSTFRGELFDEQESDGTAVAGVLAAPAAFAQTSNVQLYSRAVLGIDSYRPTVRGISRGKCKLVVPPP
jgi:hypothetical protein